jgi:transposase
MVEGTEGSHSHKEGPIKMSKHNIVCAGIDTGKNKLDVAIAGAAERWCFANTPQGHAGLLAWLRAHHVERIGIEASGGYERAVVAEMRGAGFVVIMFQPAQVRSYARFRLQRAKNDKIDAGPGRRLHGGDRDDPRAARSSPRHAGRAPDADRPDH